MWVRKPRSCASRGLIVVVIVEARFADRDDLRMPCVRDEIGCGDLQFLVGVVRMRADRAINVGKALGDRQHIGEPMHARRDRDHARNPGRSSAHDNVVKLVGKIRKIQMAMAVDQHGYCARGRLRLDVAWENGRWGR